MNSYPENAITHIKELINTYRCLTVQRFVINYSLLAFCIIHPYLNDFSLWMCLLYIPESIRNLT